MTARELEVIKLINTTSNEDEEYSIPLDISDIITICREFNKLGWQIQNQVENILDVGVEESIKNGTVRKDSLPQIKSFLNSIMRNPYFGDAVSQADDCIKLIHEYEDKYQITFESSLN